MGLLWTGIEIPWQIFRHIICYISLSLPLSLYLLCMQVMQLLRRVISQVAIVELGWQQIVWILMCIPMYCLPKERGRRVLWMCVHQPGVGVTAFQSKPLNNSNRMLNVAPQVKKSGQSFTVPHNSLERRHG